MLFVFHFLICFVFLNLFYENGFCSSLIVRLLSSFLFSQRKFLKLDVRNCPAMVFLRSVHTFSRFLKSNWSSNFDHAETGSGAKKELVLRCEVFTH